jgi:hypothetical protein
MYTISLTTTRNKLLLKKFNEAGELVFSNEFKPHDIRDRSRTVLLARLSDRAILKLIGRIDAGERDAGSRATLTTTIEADLAPTLPTGDILFKVRGLYQPAQQSLIHQHSDPLQGLLIALATEGLPETSQPVCEWDDPRLCNLDLDQHFLPLAERPTASWWESRATICVPRPVAWNYSHGRGAHFYYVARDGYEAGELAAAAALWWLSHDSSVKSEIISRTRLPDYSRPDGQVAGPVQECVGTTDISTIARWLTGGGEATQEEIDGWLQAHDMEIGKRYPHDKCPLGWKVHGDRSPVVVSEQGIYCHSCASVGGNRTGFRSWPVLLNKGIVNNVANLVKHKGHWAHARLVLMHQYSHLHEALLQRLYRAAIRLVHPDYNANPIFIDRDLIRIDGAWWSADGRTLYRVAFLKHALGDLPTCIRSDGSPDLVRLDMLMQGGNLARTGYPNITLVRGCKIHGQHLPYDNDQIVAVTQTEVLQTASREHLPRYLTHNEWPMSIDAAWQTVENYFPGVHRPYLELLLAARGVAEASRTSIPPIILVTGPTASGKSAGVQLAAAIAGDHATEVIHSGNTERLRQNIKEGLNTGTFICLNEVLKNAKLSRAGLNPREALDPILSLTKHSSSHVLYVGPRSLGVLPALVLTDTTCPSEVHDDQQLARRIIHVTLQHRVFWQESLTEHAGGRGIDQFRLFSVEAAQAANVILSHLIDRYFSEPHTFEEIARDIGFSTLEKSDDFEDMGVKLHRLFDLVCADTTSLPEVDARRLGGRGWVKIVRGSGADLETLWTDLCDPGEGGWITSRHVDAADWSLVLGWPGRSISCDIKHHGNQTVFIRFREGTRKAARVNGEISAVPLKLIGTHVDPEPQPSADVSLGAGPLPPGPTPEEIDDLVVTVGG